MADRSPQDTAEAAPRRSRSQLQDDPYRDLLDRADDAMVIYGDAGFIRCNDAAVRLFGFTNPEEMFALHPSDISPPQQPDGRSSFEKANEMLARAAEHGTHRFEWTHRHTSGTAVPCEVVLTPLSVDGHHYVHAVMRDITQLKLLEDQLRHFQKMEALGKLAGGIAHDFNNLLVVVLGQAELLELHVGADGAALEHLREIQHAGERAATLVSQLLAFSRNQPLNTHTLDVNKRIEASSRLLRALVGDRVEVELELAANPPWIRCAPAQLEQILMNLAGNARDAMASGGRFLIRTSTQPRDAINGIVGARVTAPAYVVIEAEDTGSGMSQAVRDRAFDPFFTTKEVGKGTGLGLSTVYGIATQQGGTVALRSELGLGTCVTVYLPLGEAETSATRPAGEDGAVESQRGRETILVVEDDADVRTLVVNALEVAGYAVRVAADGQTALALLQAEGAVDLVLSDLEMPKLSGLELRAGALALGHGARWLFMSGYAENAPPPAGAGSEAPPLLRKPFRPRELLGRVREALDSIPDAAGAG